jgi:hypothetical protein
MLVIIPAMNEHKDKIKEEAINEAQAKFDRIEYFMTFEEVSSILGQDYVFYGKVAVGSSDDTNLQGHNYVYCFKFNIDNVLETKHLAFSILPLNEKVGIYLASTIIDGNPTPQPLPPM